VYEPQVNSPFTSLADVFYNPTNTSSAGSQGAASVIANSNPYLINKQHGLNRGTSRGMWPSFQQQGTAMAARSAAPVRAAMSDDLNNAQYALQKQQANEGFGQQMLSNIFRGTNLNNDPQPGQLAAQYGMRMAPVAGGLFQQLGGTNPLSQLFSMFGG
jgi:hypothetical protein